MTYFPLERKKTTVIINGNYKLLSIWGSVEGWEIEDLEIGVESFGKLVELEGEEVDTLIPVHDRGKVFSGYFSIKPSPRVKELLVRTPTSIFTLDDLPEFFTEPGRYEIFYRDKRRTVQTVYLLPEKPKLVRSLNILYRGRVYQPGEEIKESFGVFTVSYETVKKLVSGEIQFFEERDKKIFLPRFPERLRAYLFNRCGEQLYSFNSGGELPLRELPKKKLVFPLHLVFYYEGRFVGKLTIGKRRRRQQCPLAKVIRLLLNRNFSALKRTSFSELPQDSELSEKEIEAIKQFLPSDLAIPEELGRNFVLYLLFWIKRAFEDPTSARKNAVRVLYTVKLNPYLRRLANRYLKIEE